MAAVATVRKISAPGSGALAAPPCRKLGDLGADFWVIFWHFPRAKSTRNGTSMGNMRVFFLVGGTICSKYQEAMEIEYIDPPSKPWQQSMVESLMPSALQTSPSSSGRQERTACCWHRRWPWQKKVREMPKSHRMPRHYPSVSTSWGSAGAARENAGGADGSKRLIASGGRWHCFLSDFGDDWSYCGKTLKHYEVLWWPRFWVVVPYNILYILYIYINIYIINYICM